MYCCVKNSAVECSGCGECVYGEGKYCSRCGCEITDGEMYFTDCDRDGIVCRDCLLEEHAAENEVHSAKHNAQCTMHNEE